MALLDASRRITHVNPALLQTWGLLAAVDVIGCDFASRLLLEEGVAQPGWRGEVLARLADGRTARLPCAVHALRLADRPPAFIASFAVLPQVAATPVLPLHVEGVLDDAIAAAGILVCVLDEAGHFVRFNRECERVSGWRGGEILGRTPWGTVLPHDLAPEQPRAVFEAAFSQSAAGPVMRHSNEWVARSGARRRIEWSSTLLSPRHDGGRYRVEIGVDVTDLQATETASRSHTHQLQQTLTGWMHDLAERRRLDAQAWRFRQLVEHGTQEVWLTDADSRICYVNQLGAQSLGYAPVQLEGRSVREIEVSDPASASLAQASGRAPIDAGGGAPPFIVQHRHRSGLIVPKQIQLARLQLEGEWFNAWYASDMREQLRTLQRLAVPESLLQAAMDAFPGWVVCVDDDLRYRYVNEAHARFLKRDRASLLVGAGPNMLSFGRFQNAEGIAAGVA